MTYLKNSLLHQELSYAWESYFSDPELIDQFDVQRSGDTIFAQRAEGFGNRPGLHRQTWVVRESDSVVVSYASQQRQESWLYGNEINLSIRLDSSGTYLDHQLEITSEVPLLKQTISALIQGLNFATFYTVLNLCKKQTTIFYINIEHHQFLGTFNWQYSLMLYNFIHS